MVNSVASAYKKIQRLEGSELVTLLCEAVVNFRQKRADLWPKAGRKPLANPFLEILTVDHYYPRACGSHVDLAKVFLAQQKTTGARKRKRSRRLIEVDEPEYIPLRDFIAEHTKRPMLTDLPEWLFLKPDIEQITWFFFYVNQECFDFAIDDVCRSIYYGMPLYRKLDDASYQLVSTEDHDYIYFAKKAEHCETGCAATETPGRFPDWAEKYYFFRDHFSPYNALFGHIGRTVAHDAVLPLRAEFRRRIGLDEGGNSALASASKQFRLVPILNEVLARNCPGLFDGTEESWPKQEAIAQWLQENRSLSERQAKAVALIATQSK